MNSASLKPPLVAQCTKQPRAENITMRLILTFLLLSLILWGSNWSKSLMAQKQGQKHAYNISINGLDLKP